MRKKTLCIILLLLPTIGNQMVAQEQFAVQYGYVGSLCFTSCPGLSDYGLESNYVDWCIGGLLSTKTVKRNGNSTDFIMSFLYSSTNMLPANSNETKIKFILPIDWRWSFGEDDISFFFGLGGQWNFLIKSTTEVYQDWLGFTYENEQTTTGVHQLSANGSVGLGLLGRDYKIHFQGGVKYHQPLFGEAEGGYTIGEYYIDFSEDKPCFIFSLSMIIDLPNGNIMLTYEIPAGGSKRNRVEQNEGDGNMLGINSQTIVISLLCNL